MVERGAVTFWEEYIPEETGEQVYEMYGDPFGKSLCHAWGASPIYLLGRYFAGVRPLSSGYQTFIVEPNLAAFESLNMQIPIKNGLVTINKEQEQLHISTTREGGILRINQQEVHLEPGKNYDISLETTKSKQLI